MKINIAGLGPGSLDNISYKVYELLTQPNLPIYIRTKKHPVIDELEKLDLSIPAPKPEPQKRGRKPKPKEDKPKRPRGRPKKILSTP